MFMSIGSFRCIGILVEDIIPEKGGQCSFYLQSPINQGFRNKKQVEFDTTVR